MDAIIQELDYKQDWAGWTETFLREKKAHYFETFPEIKEAFEKLMVYFNQEGFFG